MEVLCRECLIQELFHISKFLTGREDHEKMLDYLRTLPAKVFERGMFDGIDASKVGLDLAPVIDGDFLPKPVAELRKESPIRNCMIGTCEHESLLFG